MMDWVKQKLLSMFGPGYVKSIARHLASVAAGVLGAYGVTDSQIEPVISAVLLYLFAQVMSFLDKKKLVEELPPAKQ